MAKKILFTANLESFFSKFLIPQLKMFKEKGYEVTIATKLEGLDIPYCDKKIDINFARSLNLKQNIQSYKQMKKVLQNEHYDIVSCHTPMGGAITRLAYKNSRVKDTKMVYMVHGFHFYKGAPILNWLLYYPVEKYLAKYTDTIITINLDDYELAQKKFKSHIVLVNGVGLDTDKFNFKMSEKDKKQLREEIGLQQEDFVMIYAAEISENKNQMWLIKTISSVLKQYPNLKLLLPGNDRMNGQCQKLVIEMKLEKQVHFLGFRSDIPQLLKISNLALSSSKREGLPVNIMEAIYCGLPVIATDCRGNRDLIQDGKNGNIVRINDQEDFCKKIIEYSKISEFKRKELQKTNAQLIQKFLLPNVIDEITEVYEGELQ